MTVYAYPHAHTAHEVLLSFHVRPESGLADIEAKKRKTKYGANVFVRKRQLRLVTLLANQFKSPLISLLLVAGTVALFLRAHTDATVIFIALAINTAVGVIQEGRAERAFEKLVASVREYAIVLREGRQRQVEISEVVPGDILVLNSGDKVAADARLIEMRGLESDESVLTGEWVPAQKMLQAIPKETRVPERANMVWMGTLVSGGWGRAVVVRTGARTEFGKITSSLQEQRGRQLTPLQRNVRSLARVIGLAVFGIVSLLFVLGLLRGEGLTGMFLMAIAIAVAAIPEGLPIAVTVVLALGMERILEVGGLVRRLVAAETLGSASVIIVDKTGTLTQARMQISHIITPREILRFDDDDAGKKKKLDSEHLTILEIGVLASSAFIENPEEELEEWRIRGRPTDKALLLAGVHAGIDIHALRKDFALLDTLSFDAERRFAATLAKAEKANRIFAVGAPETIGDISSRVVEDGATVLFSAQRKREIQTAYEEIATSGARVVGVAFLDTRLAVFPDDVKKIFTHFTFAGLIAFQDPVRKSVPAAVETAQGAGMRIIMITGDHVSTAIAIARKVGIMTDSAGRDGQVMDGRELERIPAEQLLERTRHTRVFARILPHQKKRLVQMYQAQREVVAMTGDGINDAPALRQADIGIALGSGTDVAKAAADIVLLNNSFDIIVRAIEQGRVIIDNLRRIVTYLLSTGFTEIVLIGGALAFGFPLPVLPVQILWANIVQEGFMNFAFAFEPKEDGVMRRMPAAQSSDRFFTREMKYIIFGIGLLTNLFLFGIYFYLYRQGMPMKEIRTFLFVALSIDAIFFAFPLKHMRKPIWKINIFSNPQLVAAFVASIGFLFLAFWLAPLRSLLNLTLLSGKEFLLLFALGVLDFAAIEGAKWYIARGARKRVRVMEKHA